jgi:hypothetical protein
MTPIDQIKPMQPGNWVRRPEEKRKRRDNEQSREKPTDNRNNRPGKNDRRDHQVDDLV